MLAFSETTTAGVQTGSRPATGETASARADVAVSAGPSERTRAASASEASAGLALTPVSAVGAWSRVHLVSGVD